MAQNDDVVTDDTQNPDPAAPQSGDGEPPAADDKAKPAAEPKAAGGDVLDTDDENEDNSQSTGDVLSDDDDASDEGVPDSYTFDLSDEMREMGIEIREDALEGFKAQAKEMGLTQEQFQGLVEYDLQRTQEATSLWEERVQSWKDGARNDSEFGGENYNANVKAVQGVIKQFGDKEFLSLIKSPSKENPEGLAIGNHPAFLRTMNRIAKKLGDPSLVLGDDVQKDDATESKLRRMYPSMYPKSA